MEGDLGTQIAPPMFIHQSLSGRFCDALPMTKKRDLPWQNLNFLQQQQQLQHQQTLHLNPGFQNPKSNWNPKGWEWDSNTFRAKPSAETEQEKKMEESLNPTKKKTTVDENGENLTLKLGGTAYSVDEPVVRPNKRVRSGSPGGATYPMCQVDDCKGDLSNAKDYHRRHKVCEFHSKKTQALVGKQMQRFCQQCSRFHPLSEFDEGKRSCRRRLAGHNRRRRKTQPDHVSTRMLLPEILENNGGGNLNIINLLAILARLQGTNGDKPVNGQAILDDKDRLVQFLSKINSLPASADSNTKSSAPRSFDLNISHNLQASSELPSELSRNSFAPSTTDLVTVLSAALAASSPDALAILSQGNCDSYVDDKGKRNCLEKDGGFNLPKKMNPVLSSVGEDRHNGFFGSPEDASMLPTQEAHLNLPLQLFSSSPEDDSPPNLASSRKYFSSDSSNPLEERSPSSSPPVVQKLFPLHSTKPERIPIRREDNAAFEGNTYMGCASSLELFKGSNARADNSAVSNPPYQAGYASSSGSDHSPSSSNSDSQDRTGRIIFKLFDKDPSDLPGTLRMQILNWLSNSPSEMESYIRPGCVVLSIYVSMPSIAWEELQDNLSQRVSSLVKESGLEFWAPSRFLVQTERQLASYKDSKIRLCKSLRTWSAPQIVSVMPLAVVGGEETSLVVTGRNLTVPGTKIHCTYMGGYISKEISSSTYSGTIYDDSSLETFHFSSEVPSGFGRCFVEVENGFKGNCFPIIIADASICRELRILESEFEDNARLEDTLSEDQNQYFRQPRSRVDVLHFLNELGWLFQRKCTSKRITPADFSLLRLKSLFIFSVERDWPALVKALLDILVEGTSIRACLSEESLETLSEVHLLNRAVKRRCRKMVDLLLHYSVSYSCDTSKNYLFPPNLTGPGGVTPLHLAACTPGSQEMIDALTNDPQEIGLNCWSSLLDASGNSPYMYASMRNHHSYNRLVARKIADRRNGQLSIAVSDSEIYLDRSRATANPNKSIQPLQIARSCAQCAVLTSRRPRRIPATQGLLHRPYVHSLLAIAAVCVCVCLLFRCLPQIGSVAPFEWENVMFGPC